MYHRGSLIIRFDTYSTIQLVQHNPWRLIGLLVALDISVFKPLDGFSRRLGAIPCKIHWGVMVLFAAKATVLAEWMKGTNGWKIRGQMLRVSISLSSTSEFTRSYSRVRQGLMTITADSTCGYKRFTYVQPSHRPTPPSINKTQKSCDTQFVFCCRSKQELAFCQNNLVAVHLEYSWTEAHINDV